MQHVVSKIVDELHKRIGCELCLNLLLVSLHERRSGIVVIYKNPCVIDKALGSCEKVMEQPHNLHVSVCSRSSSVLFRHKSKSNLWVLNYLARLHQLRKVATKNINAERPKLTTIEIFHPRGGM